MEQVEQSIAPISQILLTAEGYKSLSAELEHLTVVKRPEIADRIRESKDHGEFSEDNSELDEVKFEQAMVETRIAELKTIFSGAQVLDPDQVPTDFVGVGSYVTVQGIDNNVEFEIRLVSSIEADPDNDLVSNESPLGVALYGQKVGDLIQFLAPAGKIQYKILKIRR